MTFITRIEEVTVLSPGSPPDDQNGACRRESASYRPIYPRMLTVYPSATRIMNFTTSVVLTDTCIGRCLSNATRRVAAYVRGTAH
jgi:hypothetical protein